MMRFNITGGIAAASGYMQGMDEAESRENAREDRAYQRSQREHQKAQQARTIEEQQRADQRRIADAAIQTTREVTRTIPGSGEDREGKPITDTTVTGTFRVPTEDQIRQMAENAKAVGARDDWLTLTREADRLGLQRAARQTQDILANAVGMDEMQLAQAAVGALSNNQALPGALGNPRPLPGGGVAFDIIDHVTGTTQTRPFKTKDELVAGLRAIGDPATFAALQQRKQELLMKAQEKAAEPFTLKPGEQRFALGADGRVAQVASGSMPVGYEAVTDAQGNTVLRKVAPGKPTDPAKAAADAWEFVSTKGDAKLTPQQLAAGARMTHQIVAENGGKVPPQVAAEAALEVALDPSKAEPSVDLRTGKVLTVFTHPQTGEFVISRLPPPNITPEQMTLAVEKMIGAMPAEEQPIIRKAATDQNTRERLIADIETKIKTEAEQQAAANPKQAEAIRASAAATAQATRASLEAKLNLIDKHAKREPEPGSGRGFFDALSDRISGRGGLSAAVSYTPPPDSPAGRALARRQQAAAAANAEAAAHRDERARLSAQFQRDATTMAPLDLVRKYDDLRGQLPVADAARLQGITSQLR